MSPGRRARWIALALALLSSASHAQSPAQVPPADRPVPLEVVINGQKSGNWLLVQRAGELYAPREAFEEWRLQLAPDAPRIEYRRQQYFALSAIPGFRARIDHSSQTVELFFSPQSFATLRMSSELSRTPAPAPVLPSVFVNYDANVQRSWVRDGPDTVDVGILGELGLSTGLGVLTTSVLARNLAGERDLPPRKLLRLESTFTRDFPGRNLTLRLGDATTRSAMWGRDVYYGGVRFGTNFALTPGLISQPLPALSGLSTAPSTVELYVNDVLRQVSSVPPGPFVIDNFPMMTGSGEARLVVRDLLGRETVLTQSFFSSPEMLAPGLTDWSAEAGRVRRDLGVESNRYGPGFASGTYRRGVSPALTVEGRAEASKRLRLIGAGMLTVLPWHVVARAALVASHDSTLGSGGHWLLGLEHRNSFGGFTLEGQRSTAAFREIGQLDTLSPIRYQVAGNGTILIGRYGTFGAGFATVARFDGTHISTVSANFSARVAEKSTLTLTASRALNGSTGSAFGLSFLMPLDGGRLANATANVRGGKHDAYVSALQNPGPDSPFGWRALAGVQQDHRRGEAGLYYQGLRGSAAVDTTYSTDQSAIRLGAAGGVVLADGHLFATRRVEESFAVAEVPGHADVGIGIGSNVLARTNADGVALIPRLLPYMPNSVRIDPRELPINAEITSIEETVVPSWRSGVKVTFPVRSGRGALLRIVLEDGSAAPAGATVRAEGDAEEFYVARRGEAFVTGLKPVTRLLLRWKTQECPLEVVLPPDKRDVIPRVGPLTCRGVTR